MTQFPPFHPHPECKCCVSVKSAPLGCILRVGQTEPRPGELGSWGHVRVRAVAGVAMALLGRRPTASGLRVT